MLDQMRTWRPSPSSATPEDAETIGKSFEAIESFNEAHKAAESFSKDLEVVVSIREAA